MPPLPTDPAPANLPTANSQTTNPLSFMSANYVARQTGYRLSGGWGEGARTTRAHFQPLATYRERLGEIFAEIRALGFDRLDLWEGHLDACWATAAHLDIAVDLLAEHRLTVASRACNVGDDRATFLRSCEIAHRLASPIVGTSTPLLFEASERDWLIATLREQGLLLAYENHPREKTAQMLLDIIGAESDSPIGACVDTGWFGTHGYDAARAIRELGARVFYVHLKDVPKVGLPHDTCELGAGIVPIGDCLAALREFGYAGAISIEHEPEQEDPRPGVARGADWVRAWQAAHAD